MNRGKSDNIRKKLGEIEGASCKRLKNKSQEIQFNFVVIHFYSCVQSNTNNRATVNR